MRRSRLPVLLAAAALCLGPIAVRAHGIQTEIHGHDHQSTLQASSADGPAGGPLQLHSTFSNGEPVRGATVRLIAADSTSPVVIGRTDAEGRLAFVLPARSGRDAEIEVDGGAGHRDWIQLSELSSGRLQASTGPATTLRGSLLSLAPMLGLGLLGGLVIAGLRRQRG
jgi:nickel transport protein